MEPFITNYTLPCVGCVSIAALIIFHHNMAEQTIPAGPLLSQVNYPHELRQLPPEQLRQFADELRDYIINNAAIFGGHFGASLGVVELTVALHYVYNTPHDQLVWDVGHQAYGHKLITGRRAEFHTNRKYKGVSGFPKRAESEYDTFGVGHSSTSVSAALGMAIAAQHQEDDPRKVVAVIGDGAITGGMAYEALNHAGDENADVLVILNDNCMSIDPNVGALKQYLTDIKTSGTYNKLRDDVWNALGGLKGLGDRARKVGSKLEDLLTAKVFKPGLFFEALGFRYFGPVDGHDVHHLYNLLKDLKDIPGPKFLHIKTIKGKGFSPAEADQTKWHATSSPFDPKTGEFVPSKAGISAPKPLKYQQVFGHSIIELAKENDKIVGVTPAMLSGSSLLMMQKVMPERVYDVGIAEQHAATFSAGLATQGMVPFCHIYSTFAQRAYDQIIHDVAIQDLKVIFCLDRAGVVGADGATHHGAFDLAYLRALPNMIVSAPMDDHELRHLMYTAQHADQTHPFAIRYPRGLSVNPDPEWRVPFEQLEIGKGRKVSDGEEVAILSIGHPGNFAQAAIETLKERGIQPAHYDLRFVKPLDGELLAEVFSNFKRVVTVEDGCLMGGFGSAVLEWMVDHGFSAQVKRLGIPDRVVHQGTQVELHAECGYDAAAIEAAVLEFVEKPVMA